MSFFVIFVSCCIFTDSDFRGDFPLVMKYLVLPGSGTGSDVIDTAGEMVFSSFCDLYSHLVCSGSMEQEFSGGQGFVI